MKVLYGCGMTAPEEWMNFDASPTLRYERLPLFGQLYKKNESRFPGNARYGDIVKGLPIAKNQCEFIYCSHVFEHLSLQDFRVALKNTHRLLKPGGVFRLVVPDLEHSVSLYLNSSSKTPAIDFHQETLLGMKHRPRGFLAIFKEHFGNSRHLWMWDYKSLRSELGDAGFEDIR